MKKIFVSCSSSNNIDNKYLENSKKLLSKLTDNILVFGGYDSGVMGIAYHSFKESIGVVPKIYKDNINELRCSKVITKHSGECTDNLIINSDIILVLPGGVGTLMELFTAIHMKKIGEIDKPIIIYNYNGFYNELLVMLDKMYLEDFINIESKELYNVCDEIDEVLKFID